RGRPAALGVEGVQPRVAVDEGAGAVLERRALAAATAAAAAADPLPDRLLAEREREHADDELLLLVRRGVGPVRPHALPDPPRLGERGLVGLRQQREVLSQRLHELRALPGSE